MSSCGIVQRTGWYGPRVGGAPEHLPVIVEMDPPFHVTQGDKVLCRQVDRLKERWKPGQTLWVPGERKRRAR